MLGFLGFLGSCVLFIFVFRVLLRKLKGVDRKKPTSDNDAPQIKYDVFVSFSGEIRRGFLSHLVNDLRSKKINVFVDERLKKGDEIWPSLVDAIEGSSISIVIFSPKYASSYWCLKELMRIIECKERYKRIVIPVFYDVKPMNVRHQSGSYQEAFAKHGRRHNKYMVQTCRDALKKSADISGFVSSESNKNDVELLKDIAKLVQDELMKLDKPLGSNSKRFVGIAEKIAHVESLICKEAEDTRLIGIWGMGGIGKTTLAEKVFNNLRFKYDGYYFLENEGENISQNLKKILSKLLEFDVEIDTPNSLHENIVRRICRMKVLIVLDDVKDLQSLEKLLGALYNFGPGSRIIVTTRDKHVLNKANEIYQLEEFSFDEALQLFNLNAFKQSDDQRKFSELSREMIYYAKGIPLVLSVLARRLCGKDEEVWKSELDKLNKMPLAEVYDVMKLSYDDLEREEQEIFLDLACFVLKLYGKVKVGYLKSLLKDEEGDISVVSRLERLKDKALIIFSEDGFISMHDCLQEMGWEIVRRDSNKDPQSRSWLWNPNDICEVLENDKCTKAIRSIQIDLKIIKERKLSPGILTKMSGLKFLEIHYGSYQHNIQVEGIQLRSLSWYYCPLTSLPENFCAEKLVMLKLQKGKIERLWDGVKNLVNLKEVDLSQSKKFVELPDLSEARNLEVLILRDCSRLTSVHPSIFSLDKLEKLDLFSCKSLTILVSNLHLRSLSYLNLDDCRNLREFSVISEKMKELRLGGTNVRTLPSLFGQQSHLKSLHLVQLLNLELTNCNKLQTIEELPPFLETLDIKYCRSLQTIPKLPLSLEILNVRNCKSLHSLPELLSSIKIRTLNAISCHSLQSLPELPPSLKTLIVHDSISLETLPKLPQSLETLDVHSCTSLQTLLEFPQSLETLDVHNCTSLQTLPELPMSLKTLDVHRCSKIQTLAVAGPFQLLEMLDVSLCISLQTLPELPRSLKTLDVHRCFSLKTLPDLPQSLETLDAQLCYSLQSLPELPKSLKTLNARYCFSLQSLPELPLSLETLDVNGCISLQTLLVHSLFLKTLDASDCKSLETLFLSTNFEQLSENRTRVLFWNCLNLDEYSLKAIGLHAQINMKRFANHHISSFDQHHVQNYNDYDVNHNHHSYQALYVYPGSSVPGWLEFKATDDYIIIDLSSASPLLGFIFCFVFRKGEVKIDCAKGRLEVHITICDGEDEGRDDNVRMYIDFEGLEIESDHVCVVYDHRCSSFLNSRVKNQTRLKIEFTMGVQDYALPQGYNGGVTFGVSPIKHLSTTTN